MSSDLKLGDLFDGIFGERGVVITVPTYFELHKLRGANFYYLDHAGRVNHYCHLATDVWRVV